MFVKKIVKDDKTYYILTFADKVEKGQGKGKDKDTVYRSYFIPEKLALLYKDCDVPFVE